MLPVLSRLQRRVGGMQERRLRVLLPSRGHQRIACRAVAPKTATQRTFQPSDRQLREYLRVEVLRMEHALHA